MMLPEGSHAAMTRQFRWDVPARLNMARQACFDWLDTPGRLAIIDLSDGPRRDVTYGELAAMTRALAAQLAAQGVARGDRVGVLRAQDPWTAAAHLAIWTLGAISLPLFKLFGPDALSVRLADSGAGIVVTDPSGARTLDGQGVHPLVPEGLDLPVSDLDPVDTGAEDHRTDR